MLAVFNPEMFHTEYFSLLFQFSCILKQFYVCKTPGKHLCRVCMKQSVNLANSPAAPNLHRFTLFIALKMKCFRNVWFGTQIDTTTSYIKSTQTLKVRTVLFQGKYVESILKATVIYHQQMWPQWYFAENAFSDLLRCDILSTSFLILLPAW